jgi:hypothetical protein
MPGPSDEPSILDARVALDACVLFPVWSCDLLLTAQEVGIIQSVIASPEIIDEARRNALERYPDKAAGIAQRFDAVSRFVEGGRDPGELIEVDHLELINAKDRHVLETAVRYEADFVVTVDDGLHAEIEAWAGDWDRGGPLRGALTTDEFIALVAAEAPAKLGFLLRTMAARRRHPPATAADVPENSAIPSACPPSVRSAVRLTRPTGESRGERMTASRDLHEQFFHTGCTNTDVVVGSQRELTCISLTPIRSGGGQGWGIGRHVD